MSLDVDLCAEYKSFYFNPIHPDFLFDSHKSKFVESDVIVTKHFDLDQSHMHIKIKGFVDLGLTNLPRLLISDNNHISRPTTILLATFKYI